MKTSNYRLLSRYICRNNDDNEVLEILKKDNTLDVMHDSGSFFNIAIEVNNPNIVKALLKHFERNRLQLYQDHYEKFKETNLEQYRDHSQQYLTLKNKVKGILETAIEDVDLSEEMKEVLSPYIDLSSNEHDQDFVINDSDIVITTDKETEHSSRNTNPIRYRKDSLSSYDESTDLAHSPPSNSKLSYSTSSTTSAPKTNDLSFKSSLVLNAENLRAHTFYHSEEIPAIGERNHAFESEEF